jgi:hypothetical protein
LEKGLNYYLGFMYFKAYTRQVTVLASAAFVCLASIIGGEEPVVPDRSVALSSRSPTQELQEIARTLASSKVSEFFAVSLNAREAADFLLTPAILTQEAISDGVLLTYPSE